jgi:hypothetical protein
MHAVQPPQQWHHVVNAVLPVNRQVKQYNE